MFASAPSALYLSLSEHNKMRRDPFISFAVLFLAPSFGIFFFFLIDAFRTMCSTFKCEVKIKTSKYETTTLSSSRVDTYFSMQGQVVSCEKMKIEA